MVIYYWCNRLIQTKLFKYNTLSNGHFYAPIALYLQSGNNLYDLLQMEQFTDPPTKFIYLLQSPHLVKTTTSSDYLIGLFIPAEGW
jgi:hypothetical protein